VAALICLGYTSRQIAYKLHRKPDTVKNYAKSILAKFDAPDRKMLRIMLRAYKRITPQI
jgi:DNA-binding NarL/FixJ family response regulator